MDMNVEVFAEDGYPTEEFLKQIAEAQYTVGFEKIIDFALLGHTYENYWDKARDEDGITYEISTGGWSGNEDIVRALQKNTLLWSMCWESSRRGGHHVLKVRKK